MPEGNGRSIHERALHAVPQDQLGMFDRVIEDDALERLLEEREEKRVARLDANGEYNDADGKVKARLSEEDISAGDVLRCGRFRIKMTHTEGTAVAFETSGSDRLFITPIA
jgi:uncharacterized protein YbjQ (UPF0145 family)